MAPHIESLTSPVNCFWLAALIGALFGPLVVAFVLAGRGNYRTAFAVLLVPAILTLCILIVARFLYPKPEDLEVSVSNVQPTGLPRVFWIYLAGAALVAAGFADFSLMAFHFQKAAVIPKTWVPVFYSVATAVSGLGSLLFGRLFDRVGFWMLIPLTLIAAASTPLVFLGGFKLALIGSAVWGLGMGVHESIIPAAVATMVPQQRRPVRIWNFYRWLRSVLVHRQRNYRQTIRYFLNGIDRLLSSCTAHSNSNSCQRQKTRRNTSRLNTLIIRRRKVVELTGRRFSSWPSVARRPGQYGRLLRNLWAVWGAVPPRKQGVWKDWGWPKPTPSFVRANGQNLAIKPMVNMLAVS